MTEPVEPVDMTPNTPPKKKLSTGAKWAIGCGSGCLVMILLGVALTVAGVVIAKNIITKYETELKEFGFETVVSGQTIEVNQPVTSPQLFKGQMVGIMTNCETDVAVLAQMCEVYGTIQGKLYFRGQMLVIHPGARIMDGIDIKAQFMDNQGEVYGEITGEYQSMTIPESGPSE
jgi:hypothetical protein